jgi:hypothetical protein
MLELAGEYVIDFSEYSEVDYNHIRSRFVMATKQQLGGGYVCKSKKRVNGVAVCDVFGCM